MNKFSNRVKDLRGKRFYMLAVISFKGMSKKHESLWNCKCDCGKTKVLPAYRLTTRRTTDKSCGCFRNKNRLTANLQHGLYGTPIYKIWDGIVERCCNKNSYGYKNYGGRGVRVCISIRKSAKNLFDLLGQRPSGLSVDRKNNNGHYSCGKCFQCLKNKWPMNLRWATRLQQCRNKRTNVIIKISGSRKCISEWSEFGGLKRVTVGARVRRGERGIKLLRQPDK